MAGLRRSPVAWRAGRTQSLEPPAKENMQGTGVVGGVSQGTNCAPHVVGSSGRGSRGAPVATPAHLRRRALVGRSSAVLATAVILAPAAWADGTPVKSSEPPAGPQASAQQRRALTPTQPGDTMWSVARRHGVAVSELARASGRAADAPLAVGAELKLPPPGPPPGGNGRLPFSQQVPIHSPRGPAYLAPEAAHAWEAMRRASLRELGVDLYPFGPDSAYRSYGKQVEAWRIFQAGGPEAAPPGPRRTDSARP